MFNDNNNGPKRITKRIGMMEIEVEELDLDLGIYNDDIMIDYFRENKRTYH